MFVTPIVQLSSNTMSPYYNNGDIFVGFINDDILQEGIYSCAGHNSVPKSETKLAVAVLRANIESMNALLLLKPLLL